jgi:outer membrane protein OmpA-like peptidoglycan-associated protein
VLSSAAFAGNAAPDFSGKAPQPHIDRTLVASSGTKAIEPTDFVAFVTNEARLTDSGYAQVDRAALWLKTHPRERLVVEGHADHVGDEGFNNGLSMARAEMVRQRLVRAGIAKNRIIMVARGEVDTFENPAEKRVRLYATTMSREAIVAMNAAQPTTAEPTQTARR